MGWSRMARQSASKVALAALAGALVLTGCGAEPPWRNAGESVEASPAGPTVSASMDAPTDGSTDVSTAVEFAYSAKLATDTKFELADAAGAPVEGAIRPGGTTWMPAKQLKYATQYTAKVIATDAAGKTAVKTATFTTMAKPANLANVTSMVGDDQTYGVAMPIVVNFGVDVPKEQRAALQGRMFVTSDPPQEGAWNWFSAKEVHFRPKEYWQPGTALSFRLALGGLPFGGKWYGRNDLNVKAKIGPKTLMVADNATKQLTVTRDGKLLRKIPVSFGKPDTPSASGNMMIMTKNPWEMFDSSSYGVPVASRDGYRTKVHWTMRIDWSGRYLHAARWSEGDQGRRNVSHGCTNLPHAEAEWLYHQVRVGDPVVIKGTEERIGWGNGWTDWEKSFDEYVKGSAIPYVAPQPATAPGPAAGSGDAAGASPTPAPPGN